MDEYFNDGFHSDVIVSFNLFLEKKIKVGIWQYMYMDNFPYFSIKTYIARI